MYEARQYASGKYFPLRVPGAPSTGLCERGVAPSTRAPELVNMCYIEDQDYCGVKLHLAGCCSWVGRWDGGGLGAVLLLCCCVLFAVAVVVAVVLIFACVYLCLRVLVCSVIVEARRSVTRARFRPPAPTLLYYYYRKPGLLQIKPTPSSLLWLGGALG